jgi:rhodanese-related sulfurtransferase
MVENIPPRAVWQALQDNPDARLVDVRTDAEWNFVGVPDLSAAGQEPVLIPWQVYPAMQVNVAFVEHLRRAGLGPQHRLYFLCRSGGRSLAAAEKAQAAGFPHAYNVADGFEGPLDAEGHRGHAAGWKAEGLPWRQR